MNQALINKINAFHLKGIRQILKIPTTYIDRRNTNAEVTRRATAALNFSRKKKKKGKKKKKQKRVQILLGDYIQTRANKYMAHIIRAPEDDPVRRSTLKQGSIRPRTTDKRRVGRPRKKWAEETLKRMWPQACQGRAPEGTPLDYNKRTHNLWLIAEASNYKY